ncbi:Gfo/Idh/MocA family protein [Nocardioides sp. MH1]|uniref:Gfo/Idh/MocA family protein n=1 Tax=Nocardioides sp. MH1 TaxID=3242490 RepID=UPI0035229D4A
MRFGLIGTGPWAQRAHGPALASTPGVELAGVWGRSAEHAASLAETLHVRAYDDVDDLLAVVDAVAFAVPPEVQADLAVRAARAGLHLLLEKPIALEPSAAYAIEEAVAAAGVASIVFHTDRFIPQSRSWFDRVAGTDGWRGGWFRWFAALQEPGNPFGASAWRQERGALWDIGPHAMSTLTAALGPIESVRATGGGADLVALTFTHRSGALSTATLTAFAPLPACGFEAAVWGEHGVLLMPPRPEDAVLDALRSAAQELVACATTGEPHAIDVRFGAHTVRVLAEAAGQIVAGQS